MTWIWTGLPLCNKPQCTQHLEVIARLEPDRALSHMLGARIPGGPVSLCGIGVSDIQGEFLRQLDPTSREVAAKRRCDAVADATLSEAGRNVDRRSPNTVGHGIRADLTVEGPGIGADTLVAGDEYHRHIDQRRCVTMHDELRHARAVQLDVGYVERQRMGQRIALGAGLGVIADEHGCIEAAVDLLHHAEWMAAPAAN